MTPASECECLGVCRAPHASTYQNLNPKARPHTRHLASTALEAVATALASCAADISDSPARASANLVVHGENDLGYDKVGKVFFHRVVKDSYIYRLPEI